jgi:hypothetical protein
LPPGAQSDQPGDKWPESTEIGTIRCGVYSVRLEIRNTEF